MRIVKCPSIADAWEVGVRHCMKRGHLVITENGKLTREAEPLALEIRSPNDGNMVHPRHPIKEKMLEEYRQELLHGTTNRFEYDYHTQLFHYSSKDGVTDQIQYIINKLKEEPTSRRAVAITWDPGCHPTMVDVPCLQLVSARIRAGRLDMEDVFRSNDMFLAAGCNMFAMVYLQQHIAEKIGVRPGTYTHVALCPHVYLARDQDLIEKAFPGITR